MKKESTISLLLTVFCVAPIWFYLLYKILTFCQATDLMWFLYWVYIPAGILSHIFAKLGADKNEAL